MQNVGSKQQKTALAKLPRIAQNTVEINIMFHIKNDVISLFNREAKSKKKNQKLSLQMIHSHKTIRMHLKFKTNKIYSKTPISFSN